MLGLSIPSRLVGHRFAQGMLGQSRFTRSMGYKIALMDVSVAPATLIISGIQELGNWKASSRLTGIQSPLSITLLSLPIATSTSGRPFGMIHQ